MDKKIFVVLGTRPEAIKLAPLVIELRKKPNLKADILVFRQHGKVTDEILRVFGLEPTYKVGLMFGDRSIGRGVNIFLRIFNLIRTAFGLVKLLWLLTSKRPDLVIVQGDTSTGLLAAMIAFHLKISVAHVEAGLRTNDKYHPFPEEMNRQIICRLTDFHFAPTTAAKENLTREGVPADKIWLTGNTAIDALLFILKKQSDGREANRMKELLNSEYGVVVGDKKIVIVTAHRRENFGKGLVGIFGAVKELAEKNPNFQFVVPVHTNPNVQKQAKDILESTKNITLTTPISYEPFIYLLSNSYLILSDSGGIQEEVSVLGKPILVMREKTERAEGVSAGNAKLIGASKEAILEAASELINDKNIYESMARKHSEFGDGTSCSQIAQVLSDEL